MINVNEMLRDGLYDLVADIVCGGVEFKDGVATGAYENGKMITFEDLLEIVSNKQIKRFLNLEMKDDTYGDAKIKTLLKAYLMGSGLKFDNTMAVRMFNIIKDIVDDMEEISNKDEELINAINSDDIKCTDFLQYILIFERFLLTLPDDEDDIKIKMPTDEDVIKLIQVTLEDLAYIQMR